MVAIAWRSWLPWCVVIATGWVTIALYSYPGFMSFDSIEQLAQARGQMPVSDWHPPILPLIWNALEAIVPGPFPMVLLQCTLLLAGLYALFARTCSPRLAVAATLCVFVWPPVFTLMAVVWKDALMAGVLVASFAALTSGHRRMQVASLVGLLVAALLRHNAIAAVAPILIVVSPWPAQRGPWARRLAGLAIAFALFIAAQLTNRALVEKRTYPFLNSVALFDIDGTLRYAEPLSDNEAARLLAGVPLVSSIDIQQRALRAWAPDSWFGVVTGEHKLMDMPATAAQRDAVFAAWLRLIRNYPRAYLSARLRMFREVLGMQRVNRSRWHVFNAGSEDVPLLGAYGIDIDRPHWQLAISLWLCELSRTSLLFQPWAYVLIGIALCIMLRRHRTSVALLASGFSYEAALFVAAPSADFRYSTWLVTCTLIAFATYTTSRARTTMWSSAVRHRAAA